MGQIKGKGIPNRSTAGALGDVYTDLNTGFTYKCVGSYGVMGSPNADYQWKRVVKPGESVKPIAKAEPNPAKDVNKVEEKVEKKAPKKSEKKPVEKKEVEAAPKADVAAEPKKHNYTKYSENKSAE